MPKPYKYRENVNIIYCPESCILYVKLYVLGTAGVCVLLFLFPGSALR
jgi:hypothetical protein